MPTIIAYFIAGICIVGLVTIWFLTAYKYLSAKQNNLIDLEEQLRLHERLFIQTRDGPDEMVATNMLKTSRMLLSEAAKGYNRILKKPINRIPALLMGFRTVNEDNKQKK
ncbi:MAG: hypothetical protein GX957_02500 [Clostridiaceae bacterium]|nr:hypothetical protein [Clostridiaceae bacterium]